MKRLLAPAACAVAGFVIGAGVVAGASSTQPTQTEAQAAWQTVGAFINQHPDSSTSSSSTAATSSTVASTSTSGATTTTSTPTSALPQTLAALHPGTSWDWQIGGTPNPQVLASATGKQKMLDVDMENTSASQLAAIRGQGIVAICYVETGSWEDYRSDASQFPAAALGNTLDGYPSERYLNITNTTVESLIKARIKRAADKGCQGIEPDLDDTWEANGYHTGFNLSYASVLAYNHRLADYAHSLGLTFGLKNAAGTQQVADSVSFTDWALNEQCNQFSECNYGPYITANKAVFQVEYSLSVGSFCPQDNGRNYDGLRKQTSLTASYRVACRNG